MSDFFDDCDGCIARDRIMADWMAAIEHAERERKPRTNLLWVLSFAALAVLAMIAVQIWGQQ